LKWAGARSAGRYAACNDLTLTACVRSMRTLGNLAHYLKLDMGGEIAMGCMVRIWEEDDSVLSSAKLTWKADPFTFYRSSFGPACARGEARNRAINCGRNGGPTTGAC
jgi:hypothetical protein